MKVGNSPDIPSSAQVKSPKPGAAESAKAQAQTQTPVATAATPATPDESAKIQLSSAASTLLASSSGADFDADKVARVSQSITDGSFKINAGVIADKLISNAQELLTKVQR
jgi:negative regulator of flagellin synthesis FlgM